MCIPCERDETIRRALLFPGNGLCRRCFELVLVLVLFCRMPMSAQVTAGDVLGTVFDASGAVLAGARITVENPDTGLSRTAVSDSAGNYLVTLLPAGRYSIKSEIAGFRAFNVTGIDLAAGDRLRQDLHMEVGQVEQSIDVAAQAAALQSDSSAVATLLNNRTVEDTPLNGRNFIRLAQLAVGATEGVQNGLSSGNRPDDRRRTSSVAVNGQRDYANNYLVDGVDNNERYIGTVMVKPSEDALEEFRVQTNSYAADVGRTAGGVINLITKSGTNQLHGSLFEFFRNEHLDARNFFAPAGPTPVYKQNQFGGSLGGPIRKNKTFFFGDYEGLRTRQGLTFTSTVPTLAMRNGNFAGVNAVFDPLSNVTNPVTGITTRTRFPNDLIPASQMDTAGKNVANLYPLPTSAGLINNFVFSPNKAQRDDTFDVKIDHQFSPRDLFFGRFSFNDTNSVLPPQLPANNGIQAGGDFNQFAGTALQRAQQLVLSFDHTFSPTLLMDLKAAYSRYVVRTFPPNYQNNVNQQFGIPGTNIDDDSSGLSPFQISGFRGIGDSTFLPLLTFNNLFQYQGSVTYIHGTHSIKIGGDVRRRQLTPFQSSYAKGEWFFDPNFTNDPSGVISGSGNSIASLLLGYPAQTLRTKLLVWQGFRSTEFASYVMDDWRVTRWLTLNLGIRYEVFTPFTEVANRASNLADIASGKILVAGQNGASASAGVPTDWHSVAPRVGFAATLTPRTVLRGGFGISFWPPTTGTGSNAVYRDPPFVSVLAIQATPLTVINRLSQGLPPPIATDPNNPTGTIYNVSSDITNPYVQQFNFTVQREVASGFVWNVGYVGALSRHVVFNYNADLALPGPGAINPRRPYYSVMPNVGVITRVCSCGLQDYHSLQTSVEHRFSGGFNLTANYTWSHNIDDNPALGGGKPGQGFFPQLVNNFRLERGASDIDIRQRFTMVANYRLPFGSQLRSFAGALATGWQVNGVATAQTGSVYTIQTASNRANTGNTADRPNLVGDPHTGPNVGTPTLWVNPAAFTLNPLYTIGNVGRNTIYGPGLVNLDFSAFKEFKPRERFTVQFRAELFNILNHPNFGIPNNVFGTAAFGVISDTGNTLSRNIQFALKLLF
jgi:hypothetical protein